MSRHDDLAGWDAAYVLGSLSTAERREFEEHLADCARCRDAVAELSALPGLLGRIDRERAFALLEGESRAVSAPPADLVERIVARDARRRGRRRTVIVAGIAAAAAVVATVTGIQLLTPPAIAEAVTFRQVVASPLTADAELTEVGWGTRIDLDCRYAAGVSGGPWTYTMWVVDDRGAEEQVSSWNATSGSTVHVTAATATDRDAIDSIEIRAADGTALLSADPE